MQTDADAKREREKRAMVAWLRRNQAKGIYTIRVRETDNIRYTEKSEKWGKGEQKVRCDRGREVQRGSDARCPVAKAIRSS